MERTCLAIILAAGESTRMKSAMSKVLHPVAGRPMIAHVVDALASASISDVALVVGRDADAVSAAAATGEVAVTSFLQKERLGTAHAVLAARDAIARGYDDVLVVFGDTPLITAAPLKAARDGLAAGDDVVVIGFQAADPTGYGRLIVKDGALVAIREHRDASDEERRITYCNGGLMAIDGRKALDLLDRIGNANAKGEYYLTDLVEIVRSLGGRAIAVEAPEEELTGCNTRAELAYIERLWQQRRRHELMLAGVSMIAPETVFLSWDTTLAQDVLLEPNVVFGPGVRVESGAVIHAFSHLEGAHVRAGATVGPFARLRPGADLGAKSKVGNFCEVKNAEIGAGAKVNHLTYIGDAFVGAGSNIGAGTITCNYDGVNKHVTRIGANAFIGSNSSLVAPVSIGDGALVASGSVITEDVPEDAVAFGRARQDIKPGRAPVLRERYEAEKAARKRAKAAE
ncbi:MULTISPECIES: bifunctional UDP-N-acetylglucosamine diphosphorylase/glucosamine-1-phosphate N-acetyltransferase GlmU [Sinorhizobium]|jgi:bifunctional UDP-N-acetylglucosamine pyrophosphorylase/glucosamine-1-phosphate N-acetyltransferase|uniref:bifunctional UDP-N-acetylglucosamine diphosphorylase/glucosamine-1-phosphate N-acetyltransferase GlmU n=1 Tax=Sinorhizobium TaxID=28105 RepID=UPI00037A402B|nr:MULTISPECIES: bifunctional UDP-N-acetylglucosamine diphosphorylase/glucosamine-1-phosphate N-acetyltransferase GlmU [Sinorhizobium]MBL3684447.1 bifunctional UDP-N-acetylglucosamine diphosphorylase/glucosamine-1-phosphate N-acetyltransferase GlmU [Sinorhizobium meliloti]PND21887.1 bifunctional UDP-N-acetylglucosamine diphosphorylase/glucosamine-1-phosphate N-acetyltransferase GlmU [Ensifer sp. MMN_5]PND29434.1 bifunctional UDP-N-acetylglucosamine diphosphorylase/glucosamine-1-phosphate N-acety